jgi:hypothetical protein
MNTGGANMKIANYPSQEVKDFGEKVSKALYDASIRHSMGGLGGCREFDLDNVDEDVRPYIQAYLEGDLDSVAITYAAMRAKELACVMLHKDTGDGDLDDPKSGEMFVIYSANESATSDGAGFWSNEDGWTAFSGATKFTSSEINKLELPISTGQDASWVSESQAAESYAEEEVKMRVTER